MPTIPATAKPKTQRARLQWKDAAGSGFIQVDVIPSLQNTLSSTVTEFPLEDGSIIGEHVIHHPEMLSLEIAQTQTPFEDSDEAGDDIEFVKTSLPLELPQTRFRPQGMLFLMLKAEGALAAAEGAITGAILGGGGGAPALSIEVFRPPYWDRDRINDLFDKLAAARLSCAEMTLDWLGRRWSKYHIEQIVYSRSKGRQLGEFSLSLKQVKTVSTATGTLPTPGEARLKGGVDGGNRPGKAATEAEKEEAKKASDESTLHTFLRWIKEGAAG